MTNTTQGFTLIELLIVIAIIGILAVVLIPNLLSSQKRAYDVSAQSCGKSIQTYLATQQIDNREYPATLPTITTTSLPDGINAACADTHTHIAGYTPNNATNTYTFTVGDDRGSKTYTVTPNGLAGANGAPAASGGTGSN